MLIAGCRAIGIIRQQRRGSGFARDFEDPIEATLQSQNGAPRHWRGGAALQFQLVNPRGLSRERIGLSGDGDLRLGRSRRLVPHVSSADRLGRSFRGAGVSNMAWAFLIWNQLDVQAFTAFLPFRMLRDNSAKTKK